MSEEKKNTSEEKMNASEENGKAEPEKKKSRKEKAHEFWQEYKDAVKDAKKEQDKLYARDQIKSADERAAQAGQKKKETPQATAARLVMDELKKKGAVNEKKAVDVSALKNVPLATPTISYTIANLMKQGVIIQTDENKFYYSEQGYKKLEKGFLRGYTLIFAVPIAAAILLWIILKLI